MEIAINDKEGTFFMPSQPGWLHQDYKQQENVDIRYDNGMKMHVNLDWLYRYSTAGFASTCHITAQCLVKYINGCFFQQALNAITIL